MPQTKFVLKKSLELGLKPLVVINKIDKPAARPNWVVDQLFDLFVQLGASDEQLDFPICYAIARDGIGLRELEDPRTDIRPILDCILECVPEAPNNLDAPLTLQIANLGYDNFL